MFKMRPAADGRRDNGGFGVWDTVNKTSATDHERHGNGCNFTITDRPFNTEAIDVVFKDGKVSVSVFDKGRIRAYGQKKIKYCPICGRKL